MASTPQRPTPVQLLNLNEALMQTASTGILKLLQDPIEVERGGLLPRGV
jgi:hypothetical protein